jgi:hypothetical protein
MRLKMLPLTQARWARVPRTSYKENLGHHSYAVKETPVHRTTRLLIDSTFHQAVTAFSFSTQHETRTRICSLLYQTNSASETQPHSLWLPQFWSSLARKRQGFQTLSFLLVSNQTLGGSLPRPVLNHTALVLVYIFSWYKNSNSTSTIRQSFISVFT